MEKEANFSTAMSANPSKMQSETHLDVIIVGAGLSGVGAATHLKRHCPDHTFTLLEGRERTGGTWDLFRYPGIRSDSDMYTLGYAFRPWTDTKAIGDGPTILQYIRDTASDEGINAHIRCNHRVKRAVWSSAQARWTVAVERDGQPEPITLTCSFLWICGGYYNYEHGYQPPFPGIENFRGRMVHPQHWPADVDYTGKRVVVIGSGATAVTLVPAMAQQAAHVTMLQRSPTYVISLPTQDALANWMYRYLPHRVVYTITRWKKVLLGMLFFKWSKRRPEQVRRFILAGVRRALGKRLDLSRHFEPSYAPWDQRVCVVPDSDLFRALKKGSASIVTDHIDSITETGIRLRSGDELPADLIVSATGLDTLPLGGLELEVDGQPVVLNQKLSYKGMMLSDVPNLVYVMGYTNASWTLKADLVSQYVCRMLQHLRKSGQSQCTPRQNDPTVTPQNWVDFTSGYIQRSIQNFPKQGNKAPWRLHQNYALDLLNLRYGRLDDGVLEFSNPARQNTESTSP